MLIRIFLAIGVMVQAVATGRECVWVLGKVECQADPAKNLNVEIRVWDRDSFGPLKLIDPDDLMGVTFTNDDGRFQLDGCGDDFDWIPGVKNAPEPYIEIRHYCNNPKGETITLPEFNEFVPNTHDVGTLVLDRQTDGRRVMKSSRGE
ncbi:unnamed protein product [Caenorhabditis auriculariae]|uniref:Uncharacterized protein n=1 Tax=Caenorhabditis auriculariae TaxID=2777116 RepID=A0A8S1HRX4_9PELO|nr:unnamed protein product [Caenorhabditis auriculariae]